MTEFIRKRVKNVKNDVLSGITVALALVPEVGKDTFYFVLMLFIIFFNHQFDIGKRIY